MKKKIARPKASQAEKQAALSNVLIEALKKAIEDGSNQAPWHKSWTGRPEDIPHNGVTGKAYRGINPVVLSIVAQARGYESSAWLGFGQVRKLGGSVVAGSRATIICFWEKRLRKDKDEDGEEILLPYYLFGTQSVFNLDQTTGVTLPKRRNAPEPVEELPFIPAERAQAILDAYIKNGGPKLAHNGGDRAFYVPATDRISLPKREAFHSVDEYYSTAFHEAGHSTGHKSRLDRFEKGQKLVAFGSEEYSKEELVAEFTAAFVAAEAGIDTTRDNSVSYLRSWIKRLKDDASLAVLAAGKAQAAADLILVRAKEIYEFEDRNGVTAAKARLRQLKESE